MRRDAKEEEDDKVEPEEEDEEKFGDVDARERHPVSANEDEEEFDEEDLAQHQWKQNKRKQQLERENNSSRNLVTSLVVFCYRHTSYC